MKSTETIIPTILSESCLLQSGATRVQSNLAWNVYRLHYEQKFEMNVNQAGSFNRRRLNLIWSSDLLPFHPVVEIDLELV